MNNYIVTNVYLDENGNVFVSLENSEGNYGGVITNDSSQSHYVENADQLKVGDSIYI